MMSALISFLFELQIPMPAILRVSADFVLGNAIQRCLADEKLDISGFARPLFRKEPTGQLCILRVTSFNQLVAGGRGRQFDPGSFWGQQTGPNPTDRVKLGSKPHLICDARGVPRAIQLTGASTGAFQMTSRSPCPTSLFRCIQSFKNDYTYGRWNARHGR
jgi:hypothetical protein